MSGIITAVNRGIHARHPAAWLHSFAFAWPAAFPLVPVPAPRVRPLVAPP